MKQRTHYSPTFLKNVDECPFKAANDSFTESLPKSFGDAVHTTLYESVFENRCHIEALEQLNKDLWTRPVKGPNGPEILPFRKYSAKLNSIITNMKHIPEFGINTNGWQVIDCESQLVPKEYQSFVHGKTFLAVPVLENGLYLRGAIDRLDYSKEHDLYKIVDYKTGTSEPDSFQLLTNALMIIYPYNISKKNMQIIGEYHLLEKGTVIPFEFDSEQLIEHYNRISKLVRLWQSGIYQRKPSAKACLWCTCDCPQGKHWQMKGR